MKLLCIILLLGICHTVYTQPLFDAVNIRYQRSPQGKTNSPGSNAFTYLNFSVNIPLVLKKDSSMIIFSPYFEDWKIGSDSFYSLSDKRLRSIALPVSLVKPLGEKWTLTLSAIPRWNGYTFDVNRKFQMGGAFMAAYKKRPGLQYKFGLYYNAEFSGPFFMPLLGIDWQIDARNNLYGVLPGNLVFEHKVSRQFYWGASFRSVTNSYRTGYSYTNTNPRYLRIQDIQAELFADVYLSENVVMNVAAGHSFARKFREGYLHETKVYYHDQQMNAGFYAKVSFAYRIRLR